MVHVPDLPGSLEHRIKAYYDSLPSSERRLADVILDFPGEIASYQAAELAAKAGVSKAAATRLFKRLGYRDFKAVRLEARQARATGSPVHLNRIPVSTSDFGDSLSVHLNNDIANLTATFESIDPTSLARLVQALAESRRIFIVGYRNSYVLGAYLEGELSRIRPGVVMLPRPGQTLAEDFIDISPEDIVVVVGLRRRVLVTTPAIDLAQSLCSRVLLITDAKYQGISAKATWVIRVRIQGVSLFDSYVGVLSIMNFICTAVAEQLKGPGRQRLKQIDAVHRQLNELINS